MLKYYCDHCRLLYNHSCRCTGCGTGDLKQIWIEVQNQSEQNK